MKRQPRNPRTDKLVNERLISMAYGQIGEDCRGSEPRTSPAEWTCTWPEGLKHGTRDLCPFPLLWGVGDIGRAIKSKAHEAEATKVETPLGSLVVVKCLKQPITGFRFTM